MNLALDTCAGVRLGWIADVRQTRGERLGRAETSALDSNSRFIQSSWPGSSRPSTNYCERPADFRGCPAQGHGCPVEFLWTRSMALIPLGSGRFADDPDTRRGSMPCAIRIAFFMEF